MSDSRHGLDFSVGIVNAASVRELEALQAELQRLMAEVDPATGLRDTMTLAVGMLHRYGAATVHVKTGRLKNSLFWDVQSQQGRVRGVWGTNVLYAPFENARGGNHAFVDLTAEREGPNVAQIFQTRISEVRR